MRSSLTYSLHHQAITGEGVLRQKDVLSMLRALQAMHARYGNFLDELVSEIVSTFFTGEPDCTYRQFNFDSGVRIPPKARVAQNDQKHDMVILSVVPDLKQHRVALRTLVEMFLCGFIDTNYGFDIVAISLARARQLKRPLSPGGLELMANIAAFFRSFGREFLGRSSASAIAFEEENKEILDDRPVEYV